MLLVALACRGGPVDRGPGPRDTAEPPPLPDPEPFVVTDGGPVVCADPSRRDEARFDRYELRAEAEKPTWMWGAGIVAADFDQDGHTDLVLPGAWETMLYRGLGNGAFAEVTDWAGSGVVAASGGTAADYDGDGDLDLFITGFVVPNVLLRNDGLWFTDVTEAAGLWAPGRRAVATSWSDFDRDGDLDLYIGCYGFVDQSEGSDPNNFAPADPDWLYVNNGDGTFTDASDRLPASVHDAYGLAGGFHDLDLDGWPDLYAVADFGNSFPSKLLWNREGTLVPDDNAHGLDLATTGMGLGVGDIDRDGVDDLVVSAWNGNSVMLSGAAGAWFESVDLVHVDNDVERKQRVAWGNDVVDIDDDGDLDVPMSYGYLLTIYQNSRTQPDAMYLQGDDGTFTDVAPEWGIDDSAISRGFVAIDLNDDGYLDIAKRQLDAPTQLLLSRCGSDGWLRIRLRQPGPNPFAIGARVLVQDGAQRWSGTVRAGGTNHASGAPPELHFGLGDRDSVPVVDVVWPDGEISRLTDLATRRVYTVDRR